VNAIKELSSSVSSQQTQITSFSENLQKVLKANVISANRISTDSLTIAGINIRDYISDVVRSVQPPLSPIPEIPELKTDVITPLGSDSIDLLLTDKNNINPDSNDIISPLPAVRIKNSDEEVVTSFDTYGNISTMGNFSTPATVSAQTVLTTNIKTDRIQADSVDASTIQTYNLNAQQISTDDLISQNATIAGTLRADRIRTSFGDLDETLSGVESSMSSVMIKLGEVESQTRANQLLETPAQTPPPDLYSELSATTAAILESIFASPPETPVAVDLSGKQLTIDSVKLFGNITALGGATLGETMIAGSLMVDATVLIDVSGIQSLGMPLAFQKSKLFGIDFMDGSMVIDEKGNVTIAQDLLVQGAVHTTTLSPLSDDLTINLSRTQITATDSAGDVSYQEEATGSASSFGKLLVKGIDGQTVASFDSAGGATVSGTLSAKDLLTQKLSVVRDFGTEEPTENTASVGESILPRGKLSVMIPTSQVTGNSLIFITPTTPTDNILSVTETQDGLFTVSVTTPSLTDITFNWWVIN
ncbi:TPA: hypothetical protein DIS60_00695, partial [Patescibacteria group bacterium]|nr:hypothetical protein [Patescibacteria group bacterium]